MYHRKYMWNILMGYLPNGINMDCSGETNDTLGIQWVDCIKLIGFSCKVSLKPILGLKESAVNPSLHYE